LIQAAPFASEWLVDVVAPIHEIGSAVTVVRREFLNIHGDPLALLRGEESLPLAFVATLLPAGHRPVALYLLLSPFMESRRFGYVQGGRITGLERLSWPFSG
jgi:hypothetical protein